MKLLKNSIMIIAAVAIAADMCYTSHRSGRRVGIAEVEDRDKVMIFGRSLRADCNAVSSTPLWASVLHGGQIMVCKHQLSLCKLNNCSACDHHGEEERCPFAYRDGSDDTSPTFDEAISIYKSVRARNRHRDSVISSVSADISKVGLSATDKCSTMTRAKFKALIDILNAPMADGRVIRGETIKSHLAAFRSISSEWMEDAFNDRGFELPVFSIPKIKTERPKVQEVSDRTIRRVEIQMEKWLASGIQSDADAYKLCFFALYCGMRAGDICSAKWDIIKRTTSGVMVVYTPHKTIHSTGVTVSFMMDNKTFVKIEPMIGMPDEFVISRHANRTPKHVTKDGMFAGMHVYLRRKVNAMLSACGIGNDFKGQKKVHALRKYFETDRVFSVGCHQAAKECGHTIEVQKRSYLGTIIGKIS